MQNLQMPWFAAAGAGHPNPMWMAQPFLDFGLYAQQQLQEKALKPQVKVKKSFSIESILADDDDKSSQELKRVASHPYFPAIHMPIPAPSHIHSDLHLSRSHRNKRIRTIFTHEQLEQLEKEFNKQQYMVGSERYYLANQLRLTEAQVKVWFQNRRIKWRKQNLEGGKVSDLHDFYNIGSTNQESDTSSDSGSDAGSL